MSIINAIWKLKKVVTITPNNYNELKKVTDLVDGFIKNKQAVLSKKQNKIFNQQKNEIKRFEDSQEANRDDIIGGLNRLREYLGGTPPKKSGPQINKHTADEQTNKQTYKNQEIRSRGKQTSKQTNKQTHT